MLDQVRSIGRAAPPPARTLAIAGLLALCSALVPFTGSAASTSYLATQIIGPAGETDLFPPAVDDAGQVLINLPCPACAGASEAALWSGGTTTRLGSLGGTFTGSNGVAMNNIGDIVGQANSPVQGRAFVWSKAAGMRDLGLLGPCCETSANGINDSGQIIGGAGLQTGFGHAVMWTPTGVITDLGTLPGDVNSEADGINNAGQVVGVDRTADGSSIVHGWTWSAGGGMQSLDPPGGWMLDGFSGIDDSGRVAGTAMDAATARAFAFIYGAGRWTSLGTLAGDTDSFASAINSVGQVVGSSGDSSGSRAFLWSPTTGMVDLNAVVAGLSGDRLTFASSISPNGNITADTAFEKGSANHAYLLSVAAAPPVTITVPADINVPASSPTGAVVTFSVSAAGGVGALTVACAPASGSTFPIGTTTVICSAADAFGHSASARFGVMVAGAPQQMAALQASFVALGPKLGTSLTDKLQTAQTDLGTGAVTDACGVLSALIHEMQAQSGKHLSAADAARFVAIVQRIIAVLGCT